MSNPATSLNVSAALAAVLWTMWHGHPFTWTDEFFFKTLVFMELWILMFTDVLSIPTATQLFQFTSSFFKASSINPNRLYASFFLNVHISNNWDTTLPSFMSKTRTSKGFNLTCPSSFDPSVHKAYGPSFIHFTSFDLWKKVKVLFYFPKEWE